MTRETKIGLLVGLAFIVLFAIILSERGSPRPEAPAGESSAQAPAPDANRYEPGRPAETTPSFDHPNPLERERRRQADLPLPGRLVEDRASRPPEGITPLAGRERDAEDHSATEPSDSGERAIGADTTEEAVPPRRREQPARPRRPRQDPPALQRKHEVVRGDCLGDIAKRYYGTARKEAVEAIFQANRHILSDRNTVVIGQKLVIPAWSPQEAPTGPSLVRPPDRDGGRSRLRREFVPAAAGRRGVPDLAPMQYRWYQVRQRDTFCSIAEQLLGSQKHWRQIWELNKDKFPDKDKIRYGVKIKVPVAAAAVASGRSNLAAGGALPGR